MSSIVSGSLVIRPETEKDFRAVIDIDYVELNR